MSILVVEDDKNLTNIAILMLEMHGYECYSALSIPEAVEVVMLHKPTTILCDFLIASTNCTRFLRSIKQFYKDKEPNIVIMSGWPRYKELIKDIKVVEFLDKPFNLDKFDEIFKKYN